MGCFSKWDIGGCGCQQCNCPIPQTIHLTDSYQTIALNYTSSQTNLMFQLGVNEGWIGNYDLPGQQVASGCAIPPYPAPYGGSTPIRYVVAVDGQCNIYVFRAWGTTNLVQSPPAIAYVDCSTDANGVVSSPNCGGDCNADWQSDHAIVSLDKCNPLPVSVTLTLAPSPPGSPLGAGVAINV